jgi:hypothetical protein
MQSTEARSFTNLRVKNPYWSDRFERGQMKLFLILNSDSGLFSVESWQAIALGFKKIIFQVRL